MVPESLGIIILPGIILYFSILSWMISQYYSDNPDASRLKTRAEKTFLGVIGIILITFGVITTMFSLMNGYIIPIVLVITVSPIIIGILPVVMAFIGETAKQGEVKDGI